MGPVLTGKTWILACAAVLLMTLGMPASARADSVSDCFGEYIERRIEGCTALIESGDQRSADLSLAYDMRALAYSLKGNYDRAIPDYDQAINMKPDFAVALNNRAWAYYRWGKPERALIDVEKSLEYSPTSAHTLDTRAHIKQVMGDPEAALRDYDSAMWFGGGRMVKLYQCGLTEARLYTGEIDGIVRPEFSEAMKKCVRDKSCDPLPADEHCRAATS
jgi:tetratricopeptide (TPR) repeat protein